MTIIVIAVAFVARIVGLGGHWSVNDDAGVQDQEDTDESTALSRDAFFLARFFLAAIAPLLFSRLLFLSQIDDTLGPMTQVRVNP